MDLNDLKILAFNDVNGFIDAVNSIVTDCLSRINRVEGLKKALTLLDITTLRDDDYKDGLIKIAKQSTYNVNGREGTVAGICVYSNLLPVLNEIGVDKRIRKVVVSGGFPTGQLSLEGKLNDVGFAIENMADEVDVPINRGLFFENHDELAIEISAMKSIVAQNPKAKLKVILETSELKSYENVYKAAMIAMQNGADFVKTSTGKAAKGADIYSSAVMIMAVKEYMQAHCDRQIGFKVAGGIRTCEQVLQYYALMTYFFSEEYIDADTFRIGCSNLKDEIINNIQ